MSGVVAFAGSRSVVSPLVVPAVRSVLASGRDIVVGCARGVDRAVAAEVVGSGHAARLGVFAVAPVPGGSWAAAAAESGAVVAWGCGGVPGRAGFAHRSRLVLAASVAAGAGGGLVAFPSVPCPAVCAPAWGSAVESAPVVGGGSGTWLAVALAVGAGLPVAVFAPLSFLPSWGRGAWVSGAASGVWSACWRWDPAALSLPGCPASGPLEPEHFFGMRVPGRPAWESLPDHFYSGE